MSSSTFSSEHLRRYAQLPTKEKLCHIGIAGALVMVVFIACEFITWFWGEPLGTSFESIARRALSEKTEVVFAGSSHTRRGVWAKLFDRETMGVALKATDYRCLEAVLENNLERMPNLKCLVLESDHILLQHDAIAVRQGDVADMLNWGVPIDRLPMDPPGSIKDRIDRLSPFMYRRLVPRHLGHLIWTWTSRSETIGPSFETSEQIMSSKNDGGARARAHFSRPQGDVLGNQKALLNIIRTFKRRGVDVVLMRYPHHRTYFDNIPREIEGNYCEALQLAYRQGCLTLSDYWDFGTLAILLEEDFHDGDHLNTAGARKFSRFLNERVEERFLDGKKRHTFLPSRIHGSRRPKTRTPSQ